MPRPVATTAAALLALTCAAGCSDGGEDEPARAALPLQPPTAAATPTAGLAPAATAAPDVEACARAAVDGMSLRQRARQLLMVGVPVNRPARPEKVLAEGVGGVILTGRTTAGLPWAKQVVSRLQRASSKPGGAGLLVAVDQEGGEIRTLRGPGLAKLPAAVEQGTWPAEKLARTTAEWSRGLAGAGITLDLAPVADVVPAGTERDNPPVGELGRQYGSDPAAAAEDVATVVRAMQGAGVLATVKHFPGLGRVKVNTDFGTGATDPEASADDPHLEPFRAGIAAGAAAVMISSAVYPRLSKDPAVFSDEIVHGQLRSRLGFTGLVVSDDLSVAEAVQHVPVGERATRFVAAGGDLVIAVRAADAGPMTSALVRKAEKDANFAATVNRAAVRVLLAKRRAGALGCAS